MLRNIDKNSNHVYCILAKMIKANVDDDDYDGTLRFSEISANIVNIC